MAEHPFVLVDAERKRLFAAVAAGLPGPREGRLQWVDDAGVPWLGQTAGGLGVAVTWLGPGWVFDPHASAGRAGRLAELFRSVREADGDRCARELRSVWRRVPRGGRAARVLWATHRAVVAARRSVVRVPGRVLGAAVWGNTRSPWPRHWRGDLGRILKGLTWLHVADWPEGSPPPAFGPDTALFTHAADLRGNPDADGCDEDCPLRGTRAHSHFLINVGRGFPGVLEDAAGTEEAGLRPYPALGPGGLRALRKLGKTGRLVSAYLPALLGEPGACGRFTPVQHGLLQALVRETTRAGKADPGASAVLVGNVLPRVGRQHPRASPLLDALGRHVGFNGNGKRKGLGYRLLTPGGWLAKAGYPPAAAAAFLDDLAALAGPLRLTAVGLWAREDGFANLAELRALAGCPVGRRRLDTVHLRVYAPENYVSVWNEAFGWAGTGATADPSVDVAVVAAALQSAGGSRRRLALALGEDLSFLGKVLSGHKRCPARLARAAKEWLATTAGAAPTTALSPAPAAPGSSPPAGTPLATASALPTALDYLRRGWGVVPQLPRAKHPCVRWKPYQDRLPREEELTAWFDRWPQAGLALVLGPVSDVFVLDVDGEAAHRALLDRLGREPDGPKALSGSGKPYRYHLFFRHPGVPTRARATPWHDQLEFRGKGGVVILPPSLHKSGRRYAWAPGRSLGETELSDVPPAVLAALSPSPAPGVAAANGTLGGAGGGPLPPVSPSTRRFLDGVYADGPNWNQRLFRAACDLKGRGVPFEVARDLLLAGARPWDASQAAAALKTIASAYAKSRQPGLR